MRDPKRIDEVMDLITSIWSELPDLRFNQLIHCLQVEYSRRNTSSIIEVYEKIEFENGSIIEMPSYKYDLFNVEDDEWIKFLIDFKENI